MSYSIVRFFAALVFILIAPVFVATAAAGDATNISDLTFHETGTVAGVSMTRLALTPLPPDYERPDDYGYGDNGSSCPSLTRTLTRGMRDASTGGQVSDLQVFLADHFNLDEEMIVTGFFGRVTQQYVIKFQQEQGLPALGIVGQLTRARIAQVCGGSSVTPTPPIQCPVYQRPICSDFEELITEPAGILGCTGAPRCQRKIDLPVACPLYMPPLCAPGEVLVGGGRMTNGCDAAPRCQAATSTAAVSISASLQKTALVNGVDRLQLTYTVTNAPANSNIKMDIYGAASGFFGNGVLGLVSPYPLVNGSRSFDLSQQQSSFPTNGTITMSVSYASSLLPVRGPLVIVISSANGTVLAEARVPISVTAPDVTIPVGLSVSPTGVKPLEVEARATLGTWTMYTYRLDFGDTKTEILCNSTWTCSAPPGIVHTYAAAGTYNVRLIAVKQENGVILNETVVGNAQVTVTDTSSRPASITLTAPSSGAGYKLGDSIPLAWYYRNVPPNSQVIYTVTGANTTDAGVGGGSGQTGRLPSMDGSGSASWQTGASGSGYLDIPGTYEITAKVRECYLMNCDNNADFPGFAAIVKTYAVSNPVRVTISRPTTTASPRLVLGTVTRDMVSGMYYDMPANTQIILVNQTSGARVDSVSTYIQNGGTGSFPMTIPSNLPAGTYYLKAWNYSTQAYLAQTVAFTIAGVTANAHCTYVRNGATSSTIAIEGGTEACISWCRSQAAEDNAVFACYYGGSLLTTSDRISSASQKNLANALTALEAIMRELIAKYSE